MAVDQVVILGAGVPHRGSVPAALRADRGGIPVLEWLLDALKADVTEVTLVGGYGSDAIRERYPGLRIHVLNGWERSGSAASLLATPLDPTRDTLVVYSDVLIRPNLVASVRQGSSDVTVTWDSYWRHRFAGRRRQDLERREKVLVADSRVERCGPEIALKGSGEFVGLVRLSSRATKALLERSEELMRTLPVEARLSQLIEVLRLEGMSVDAIDAQGDWAEVNDPSDIARFVLGTKADTLARVGRLVTRSRIAEQVTRTVAQWESDPGDAIAEVAASFGERRLIVRSSTTHEDTFTSSNAGGFTSVLGSRATDGLLEAVEAVTGSYRSAGIDAESQQVLIQPLIDDVVCSGVVLTRTLDRGAPWMVVEYADGSDTEQVTSGGSDGTRALFIHRRQIAEPSHGGAALSEFRRLSPVLDAVAEVESLLGHDSLDVEFAVDSAGVVHLLQVRPAVAALADGWDDSMFDAAVDSALATWDTHATSPAHLPGAGRLLLGVMPDWNPAEIIGTAPGRLALDLYRHLVTDEVWARQRAEVGYRDVRPAPLLVNVAERPYVDVRASFASFLPATLEEELAGRLLSGGLDRLAEQPWLHDKVEFAVMPTCVDPDWSRWEDVLSQDSLPAGDIDRLRQALGVVTGRILGRVDSDLAIVERLEAETRRATTGVDDPLARAAVLLDRAIRFGTLPFAHLARAAFVAVSLLEGARARGAISADALAGFHATVRTVSGDLSVDAAAAADGRLPWARFVSRWGHLRPGTYEITSPRYDADPDRFLRPLLDTPSLSGGDERVEVGAWRSARSDFQACIDELGLGVDGDGVESLLRRAIEGREWAKLAFTRNLSDALEAIARGWEARGIDRATVSDAPLALLLPGGDGGLSDARQVRDAAEEGRARRQLAASTPLPALITDRADISMFLMARDVPNFVGTRSVIAPTVRLENIGDTVEQLDGRIVLIPRADPGFDWIFGHHIAGLVTLYGGANSHMAIRAAEHGLPAAIGVGEQRYRDLVDAVEVEIDPRGRTLRALR